MRVYSSVLTSKDQTGREMYRLISRFSGDLQNLSVSFRGSLVPLAKLPLPEFFDFVKDLPYRIDDKPIEIVARPRYIIAMANSGIDCKKKSVLMASWLRENGLRYRLMTVSNRPSGKIHHVYAQVFHNGKWLNLDATYARYRPFAQKRVTNWMVLKP